MRSVHNLCVDGDGLNCRSEVRKRGSGKWPPCNPSQQRDWVGWRWVVAAQQQVAVHAAQGKPRGIRLLPILCVTGAEIGPTTGDRLTPARVVLWS